MKPDMRQTIVESCALDEEGHMHRRGGQNMNVLRWVYKQNLADTRRRKTEKVSVGPGLRDCGAGYETNNCGKLRVRWRGLLF